MEQINKSKISLYGIISAVAFIYLILNEHLGISVPIFFIIQFAVLFYVSQNYEAVNTKGLLMMVPIFIISLLDRNSIIFSEKPILFRRKR